MNLPHRFPINKEFTNLLFGHFKFGALSIDKDIIECISTEDLIKFFGYEANKVDIYPFLKEDIKETIIKYNSDVIISIIETSQAHIIKEIYKDPRNKNFYIHIGNNNSLNNNSLNKDLVGEYKNLDQTTTACLVELFNNSNMVLSIEQKENQKGFTISKVTINN